MHSRICQTLAWVSGLVVVATSSNLLAFDDDDVPALHGYVKTYGFQQAVDPYALERVGSRLQLSVRGGLAEPATYYSALDFELDSSLVETGALGQRDVGFEIYPVEVYVNLALGNIDLRLGKQFIFWGRAAWVNPTDVIAAWDYANIASEIEDYRVAPLAARASWYIVDELMLDLVLVPLFQPNRIPMTVPTTMGDLPVVQHDPLLPGNQPWDAELGLRLSHSMSLFAFDWAIAAFLGYDKSPTFDVAPIFEDVVMGPPGTPAVSIPTSMSWQQRYERLWMLGADFAKALGPFVLKGEAALKSFPKLDDDTKSQKNSRAEYVLGLDYVFNENFDCGVQYVGNYTFNYDVEQIKTNYRKMTGSDVVFVDDQVEHALSLRLNFKIIDSVGGQVLLLYNVNYVDFMALGFVHWDIADALKLYVGALAFGGEKDSTPYGRQADFSRVFVELKYSF